MIVFNDLKFQVLRLIYAFSIILLSEFFYRLCQIFKEARFYKRNYTAEGRYSTIIRYCFTFNDCTNYLLLIMTVAISVTLSQDKNFLDHLLEYSFLAPIYIIVRYTRIFFGRIEEAEWIRSDSGLDYGTGMASNYFHGYLYLILPHKGDGVKGIRERLQDYEDRHRVKFAIKKLLIIVPDSMHSAPKIESPRLERVQAPEEAKRDRAGVKRCFDNAVYRFTERINGETYYICVEGATPLHSFREAMRSWTTTPLMKALYKEIVIQFYKTLKKCIHTCPETENECEIIYFPDSTLTGDQKDIGLYLQRHFEKRLRT